VIWAKVVIRFESPIGNIILYRHMRINIFHNCLHWQQQGNMSKNIFIYTSKAMNTHTLNRTVSLLSGYTKIAFIMIFL